MKTAVIMQARTTSTRLPGKALLPLAGYSSAILSALRSSNLGHELRVATSDDSSDDALTEKFCRHGIRVIRGPLNDVLARYCLAANDLPDDCIVVRMTGDNVLPDGSFVAELAAGFSSSGVEYMTQDSAQTGLPYGLGGEAFSAAALRRADAFATSAHDREHVGPWMRRNCKSAVHVPKLLGGVSYSHLRCTIDDDEDYRRVISLFDGMSDPVHAGWYELLQKLASIAEPPTFRVPVKIFANQAHSEMTLGTAQLGSQYGIANRTGKPSMSEAISMVRCAVANGVTALDTARGYEDAEHVIGRARTDAWMSRVKVITKLDPLASLAADAGVDEVITAVDTSIGRSREALGVTRLSTLLLHRWKHYRAWGGLVWRRLLELRDSGALTTLGASVYEPTEALDALRNPAIKHLQVPMNVLDRRWKSASVDQALADRPDVVVHARSALLQGLLVSPFQLWPVAGDFDAEACVRQLHRMVKRFDRENVADLCLAYVRSQPWITSVVIGCETLQQLEQNLGLFRLPKLTQEQCADLENSLPHAPESLLDPSHWKRVHERLSVL